MSYWTSGIVPMLLQLEPAEKRVGHLVEVYCDERTANANVLLVNGVNFRDDEGFGCCPGRRRYDIHEVRGGQVEIELQEMRAALRDQQLVAVGKDDIQARLPQLHVVEVRDDGLLGSAVGFDQHLCVRVVEVNPATPAATSSVTST